MSILESTLASWVVTTRAHNRFILSSRKFARNPINRFTKIRFLVDYEPGWFVFWPTYKQNVSGRAKEFSLAMSTSAATRHKIGKSARRIVHINVYEVRQHQFFFAKCHLFITVKSRFNEVNGQGKTSLNAFFVKRVWIHVFMLRTLKILLLTT